MTTPATGLFKKVAYLAETTFGIAPGPTGAAYIRRTQSTLSSSAAFFKSAEINLDRGLRDNRKGSKSIKGNIQGELSPGTYSQFMAAMIGAAAFVAGSTTGAITTVTAAAATPGTFTRSAGSFITDGFKVGDVVRWTGWATTGVPNNTRNYRITALTATVMTVGSLITGVSGGPEAVAAKAAGDSVTCTVVGKKAITPSTSLADSSFAIEHWHSDISKSELFLGCKPSQLALSLPSTGMATANFTFMGVDVTTGATQYFTTPTALSTAGLAAGVNGTLSIGGTDFATVTGLTITINGNHAVETVVGSQLTPGVFPGMLDISGQITCLFADTILRDAFIAETDYVTLAAQLNLTQAINTDFINFVLPRIKITSADKADKSQALLGTYNFQAALNVLGGAGTTGDATTIMIQDTLA